MADVLGKLRATLRAALGLPIDPGQPPDIMRLGLYRSTVVSCAADGSACDVQPEDSRIPGAQNVPVRVGVPGLTAVVRQGAVVLLGWERGDPSRPYCEPSWEPGAGVTKAVFNGDAIYIGAEAGAEPIPRGTQLLQRIQDIESKFDAHTHAVSGTCPFGGGPLSAGLAAATATPTSHAPAFNSNKGKVAP